MLKRLTILALTGLASWAQDSPLLKSVEPDFGKDATKPMVMLPVLVEWAIMPDGTPLSVDVKGAGVSHAVTGAFAQYRFRPETKAYGFALTLDIPHIIEDYPGESRIAAALPSTVIDTAKTLTPAKALQVEAKLKQDRKTAPDRSALILFAAAQTDPSLQALRIRQVAWMVQNQPQAEILRTPSATVSRAVSPEGYAEIRQLWLRALAENRQDIELLEAASNFFRVSEPEEVQRILSPYASAASTVMAWFGEAYAFAAIGITNLSPKGGPPSSAGAQLPETPFAVAARNTLQGSSDLPVLTSALTAMTNSAQSLLEQGAQLPEGFETFCESVRRRLKELKPNTSQICKVEPPTATQAASSAMSGAVFSKGALTKQVRPRYPDVAKASGIQGIVTLWGVIGKDGKISQLGLVKGPLILYVAAYDAVRQWEYRPFLMNGSPVEVMTQIEVNFDMR